MTREILGTPKKTLQSFEEDDECYACGTNFSLILRRHHCRACGRSVCGPHSSKKKQLATIDGDSFLGRVCDECFETYENEPVSHQVLSEAEDEDEEDALDTGEGEGGPSETAEENRENRVERRRARRSLNLDAEDVGDGVTVPSEHKPEEGTGSKRSSRLGSGIDPFVEDEHALETIYHLRLTVQEAKLKASEFMERRDHYCIVKCVGVDASTAVEPQTLEPFWGLTETIEVTEKQRRVEHLSLIVMGSEAVLPDKVVGYCVVPLSKLPVGERLDRWLELEGGGGSVQIRGSISTQHLSSVWKMNKSMVILFCIGLLSCLAVLWSDVFAVLFAFLDIWSPILSLSFAFVILSVKLLLMVTPVILAQGLKYAWQDPKSARLLLCDAQDVANAHIRTIRSIGASIIPKKDAPSARYRKGRRVS